MNSIVTSGKLIDYLGCGLPVITTNILYKIPQVIKEQNFGVVLDDLDVNKIDLEGVRRVIGFDSSKRKSISKWANNNLCIDGEISGYLNMLKKYIHSKYFDLENNTISNYIFSDILYNKNIDIVSYILNLKKILLIILMITK